MRLNKILGVIFWILVICFMCAYNIAHPGVTEYFYIGFFSCLALNVAIGIFNF